MATKEQKAMAIKRLSEIGPLGSAYKARAKDLINDPSLVNQDSFGICGMAASTYLMLAYDPLRFVDLLRSIFNNEEFEGIPVGIKDPVSKSGDLLEHRLEQYQRKATQKGVGDPKAQLDFIVCRSLGKLLKKTEAQLYLETKDFSKKFAPSIQVKESDILKAGDLALTGEALTFILREIVQVPALESHDPSKLTTGPSIVNTINNWFSTHKGREPFVVAAVNKGCYQVQDSKTLQPVTVQSLQWIQGKDPPNLAMSARKVSEPAYDHWIIVTGPVATKVISNCQEYAIPVWTWAAPYTARLRQDLTQGYFSWLICVALDPQKTSMPLIVPRSSPDWVADQTTETCSRRGCGAAIGKGSRHHCRLCGKLFCSNCCPELDMVPGRVVTGLTIGQKFSPIPGPVRICSDCFAQHTGFHWMRDNESAKCQLCGKSFGVFHPRHHCRYCGKLVCGDCCGKKKASAQMGYVDPVRICKTCALKVK